MIRHCIADANELADVIWRKSSFSGPNGGDCIEVGAVARGALAWRKSSYSGLNGGQCVEVASGQAVVGVRDSKNPAGPALLFDTTVWAAFVRSL